MVLSTWWQLFAENARQTDAKHQTDAKYHIYFPLGTTTHLTHSFTWIWSGIISSFPPQLFQMFSVLFKTPITHDFNNHLYVSVCAKSLHKVLLFVTLWTVAHQVLCPRDSLGKNTGVGCHDLLQGIFPIQGSNPNLLQLLNAGRFFTAEPPGKPNPTPSDHLVRRVSLGEALKSCT